jgi:adenylate cyclase
MSFFSLLRRFSWMAVCVNVGANLVGFFVVQALMHYAQPVDQWRSSLVLEWRTSAILLCVLVPAAVIYLLVLASPIQRALDALGSGDLIKPQLLDTARRRVVNLPFQAAVMNLIAWIVPSVAFPLAFQLPGGAFNRAVSILYNFSNAVMITLLAFVLMEQACRRTAIPVLFPEGGIRNQEGTVKLNIRSRLMVMYGAICLIPMFQTALINNANASLAWSDFNPRDALSNLGTFSLILFVFTASYGLWLATLFAKNLAEPTREIMDVTRKVAAGDYDCRASVVTNDEIGFLGDRFNEMSRGLKERERIREVFSLFTSPEIAHEILSGRGATAGETRRVTLLFSDLRGFTSMAERLAPEKMVESINSYFGAMSSAIVDNGGIILQYVGDEIEAVFGAPIDDPLHADKAVAAALDMRVRLEKLNDQRSSRGEEPFRHGIGIHTGPALAGIVGSRYKISYAMVGDTVNIASRIQELNKELESDILISRETLRSLTAPRRVSEPVSASVKGKIGTVEVFRLMS